MNQTFSQELINAFRGTLEILRGRREGAAHFDFSMRGLAGSFIAFFLGAALSLLAPGFTSDPNVTLSEQAGESIGSQGSLVILGVVVLLFLFQVGFGAIALLQFKKIDMLIPYLVSDNWAGLFIGALSAILLFLGNPGGISLLIVIGFALTSKINICRLILGLKPVQIAMFLVAQFIGVLSGLILLEILLPGVRII